MIESRNEKIPKCKIRELNHLIWMHLSRPQQMSVHSISKHFEYVCKQGWMHLRKTKVMVICEYELGPLTRMHTCLDRHSGSKLWNNSYRMDGPIPGLFVSFNSILKVMKRTMIPVTFVWHHHSRSGETLPIESDFREVKALPELSKQFLTLVSGILLLHPTQLHPTDSKNEGEDTGWWLPRADPGFD